MATIVAELNTVTMRQGQAGEALVLRAYQRCEWYELALMRHGFTTERLMKLSRKIANDALRLRGASLGDRFEDLVSFLVEKGLEEAMRYDPHRDHSKYGKNGGEPFQSYVSDILGMRVDDFYRRKSEGFGDRRRGFDGMVELTDDPDPADHDVDFMQLVDERRRAKWQRAAELAGWDLAQFIVTSLDFAADAQIEAAA